jgi:alpha-galactosidase
MKTLGLASWSLVGLGLSVALAGCGGGGNSTPPDTDVDTDLPIPLAQGTAPTPPMGWNSWNTFNCNVSEKLIQQIADAMVDTGMQAAGYQFVNIDDCWSTKDPTGVRAPDEVLVPDVAKFPNGMAPVADYVHSKGLKLGIYGDRGTLTCGGYPGGLAHEPLDAMTYAGWGVDYLKYDNCSADANTIQADYTAMGDALKAAAATLGRDPLVFSLCAWNFYEWGLNVGNLWRTTSDITPNWASVVTNLGTNQAFAAYAGPNGWNDPDMLEIGNFGPADEETDAILTQYQAHFSMWSIMAAPLILGNDLRGSQMSDGVKTILTNPEVIALDQDAFGYQGVRVQTSGNSSVWAKPLNENGARGVVLLNTDVAPASITVAYSDIGLHAGAATVRDLWAHADLGTFTDSYTATVPAQGAVTLKIKGQEPPHPSGAKVYLSDLNWVYASNGLGPVERDESNGASAAGDGDPLTLRGTGFAKGLGVAGPSAVVFRLAGACSTFSAQIGIDDDTHGQGSVDFEVWADGELLFDSRPGGTVTGTSPAQSVQVSVAGKKRLKLVVTNGGDGASFDRADWADAQLSDCM